MKLSLPLITLITLGVAQASSYGPDEYDRNACISEHGRGGWKCDDGCNTCRCGPQGVTSTQAQCVKVPPTKPKYEDDGYNYDECISEHGRGGWKCDDGCNTCRCDRQGITSTKKQCVKVPPTKPKYEGDGYNYGKCVKEHGKGGWTCDDGCNTCTCDRQGITSTKKQCVKVPPTKPKYEDDGYNYGNCVKEHGRGGWKCDDGCNTCRCGRQGITSTQAQCVETPDPKPDYEDNSYN